MNPETWAEIRRLKNGERLSLSEISRRLRLDRKTVRGALRLEAPPARRRSPRPSKLDGFKSFIQERLKAFPRITSVRLLRELQAMGFSGGLTQLKAYVATIRTTQPEAFFRLETLPGEQAQVDWANCGALRIGSSWRKLSAFVMVLSYSRMMYAEFTLSQCLEDFLQAHVRAFRFFGGVAKKLLYDNLKSVCLARLGAEVRLNPKFFEFSGLLCFEPVLCRPGRGNEKGKVESGIKYMRSSFLRGRPLDDFARLQGELRTWLEEVANARRHGSTRRRPIDRFQEERSLLQALPERLPDFAIVRPAKATSQALAHFDGNLYSVPSLFAAKMLTVRASTLEVRLFHGTRPVAKHPRSYDRGKVIEDPAHYAGLLEAKKAARANKATDRFLALARSEAERAALEAYLKGLLHADLDVHRHMARLLELAQAYGSTEIFAAIDRALRHKAFGAHYLQNILQADRRSRGQAEPRSLDVPAKPEWEQLSLPERDLALYDRLLDPPDPDAAKKT